MVSWRQRRWNTRLKPTKTSSSKPLPMYVHRTMLCVDGYVNTLRRCGGTMEPLGLLQFNHNRLVRYQWKAIRREQCQVSRLASTGRENPKGRARARMVKAKAKERKAKRARNHKPRLNNSKDTVDTARNGDTSVPTAENASPMVSRRVVRQQPLLTMTVMLQL